MAQRGHERIPEGSYHTEDRKEDDSRSCNAQVAAAAAEKNRHAGSNRLVARHRSVDLEEAEREARGSWHWVEERNRLARRWEMQNNCLWIVGREEVGSGYCKLDVDPE